MRIQCIEIFPLNPAIQRVFSFIHSSALLKTINRARPRTELICLETVWIHIRGDYISQNSFLWWLWAKIGHKRNRVETERQQETAAMFTLQRLALGHMLPSDYRQTSCDSAADLADTQHLEEPHSFSFSSSEVRCSFGPQLLLPGTSAIGTGLLEAEAGSRPSLFQFVPAIPTHIHLSLLVLCDADLSPSKSSSLT